MLKEDQGDQWLVEIKGADGTLYSGETFTLRFKFVERYPIGALIVWHAWLPLERRLPVDFLGKSKVQISRSAEAFSSHIRLAAPDVASLVASSACLEAIALWRH